MFSKKQPSPQEKHDEAYPLRRHIDPSAKRKGMMRRQSAGAADWAVWETPGRAETHSSNAVLAATPPGMCGGPGPAPSPLEGCLGSGVTGVHCCRTLEQALVWGTEGLKTTLLTTGNNGCSDHVRSTSLHPYQI